MRAACRHAFGDASLAGRRVVVQGTGHVGSHLVQLLVAEGADVAVADIDDDRVATLVSELGVRAVPAEIAAFEECDVLAPCALGGVLSRESVARLRCRVVCGGANNQLAERAADDALVERGIVYAPDFVVNAGGIINIAEEFTGYDRERALAATARIEGTTDRVLDEAARTGVPPGRCAEAIGRRRVREEGGGRRWTPGDPAAWTNGAPLTTLRPSAG
jgi:glutamate dehydrogenase/leucine dehydrogenase